MPQPITSKMVTRGITLLYESANLSFGSSLEDDKCASKLFSTRRLTCKATIFFFFRISHFHLFNLHFLSSYSYFLLVFLRNVLVEHVFVFLLFPLQLCSFIKPIVVIIIRSVLTIQLFLAVNDNYVYLGFVNFFNLEKKVYLKELVFQ